MAYCEKCGTGVAENTTICNACATGRGVEPNINQEQYHYSYPKQNNNAQDYGASYQGNYGTQYQDYNNTSEKGNVGWGVLGCCIPLVGLILFLGWRKSKPKNSIVAGVGALVGVGLFIVFMVLAAILGYLSDDTSIKYGGGSTSDSPTEIEEPLDSDFAEIVVVDNEECVIKITGIEEDDIWGYVLNATLENKSSDKTYTYTIDSASVNGVEVSPLFYTDVTPGNMSNEEISFSTDILEYNGIYEFTDIQLRFRVYDADDWSADDIVFQEVNVYPYGETNATKFVREQQSTDTVIVDNADITVIVTGYEIDDIWGYTANLYIVNKTDNAIMVSVEDASVNGYMLDPYYATTVSAGNSSFSSISWDETDLADNNISTINEIEFLLEVYNYDDIFADSYVNMNVVLNP